MLQEKGTVTAVLEIQTGTSANGVWKKQSFVIETFGQYPKTICFDLFASGEKPLITPKVGEVVDVTFSVESREYNGKYYTKASAFRVDISGNTATPNAVQAPEFTPLPPAGSVKDDYPF